jgi:hypothetical protein
MLAISGLATGQDKAKRIAKRITCRMNLGRKAALAAA